MPSTMRYGKWTTIRELGEGGQGKVYLATDTDFVRDIFPSIQKSLQDLAAVVASQESRQAAAYALAETLDKYISSNSEQNCMAVKVLHDPVRENEKAAGRLQREVEVLGRGLHPHIMRIVDSSIEQGWFVMPHYSLGTLAKNNEMFKGRPLEALEAFRPIVEAVAILHDNRVVHRDIKPENIFISSQGLILGDFGIVHFEDDAQTRLSERYENVGSRDWMPGWAMGIQLDEVPAAFDVFGLGKVLWAMISGRTKLQLWYHNRPQYDLREQFPHDPGMHWIARILEHSVVENVEDSMPSAREMLKPIDDVLAILRRGGQVINRSINRICRVCGFGEYRLAADENRPHEILNIGLNPGGHLRLFRCTNCGHIQIFQVRPNPPAWGELSQ